MQQNRDQEIHPEQGHVEEQYDAPYPSPPPERRRGLKEYLGISARGVAMGACDVVPGVSGGTMAFILGIYEELIESLRSLGRPQFLRPLLRFRLKEAARAVNLPFLAALLSGILVAIATLASLMTWLLEEHAIYTWSFFFGLVTASAVVIVRRVPRWRPALILALISATIAAYFLVGLMPTTTTNAEWFIFLCGAIAICAMILPGISGSFILLILGKYEYIVGKVSAIVSYLADLVLGRTSSSVGEQPTISDALTLGIFAAGCVIGLISFAQVLGWLFRRFHNLTVVLLTGLMIGSLRKVWPWKETLETIRDRHGELIPIAEQNILPPLDGSFALALLLALIGFGMVLLIEKLAREEDGN